MSFRIHRLSSFGIATLIFACAPLSACGSSTDDVAGDDDGGDDGSSGETSTVDSGRDTAIADNGGDTTVADTGTTTDSALGDTTASDTATGDTSTSDTASGGDTTAGDTSASDSSVADATDSSVADTGGDTAPTCPVGTACARATGSKGICLADGVTCGVCVDVTDDPTCTTLYGGASSPFLCLAGTCTPGNCRVDSNCATANTICGVTTPNLCGACTTDGQCQADSTYGSGSVCSNAGATSGTCVSGACTVSVSGAKSACTTDTADICCGTSGGAGTCGSGECCKDSDCATTGTTCKKAPGSAFGLCTACPAITANTFNVDPVAGDDSTGIGSTGAGCAFKTITRALQVIGATPPSGTKIVVQGTVAGVPLAATEKYPIAVTGNVTISVAAATNATAAVPAGKVGFALFAANSGISGLTIDGQSNTALNGLEVTGGGAGTTTIDHLTIKNFLGSGIVAFKNGNLTINAGVSVTGSGTTAPTPTSAHVPGLRITDSALVVINVPAGGATTSFNGNSSHGIELTSQGGLTLTGIPGSAANTGTVVANGNYYAGLVISQTAKIGGTLPSNLINGLVVFGTTNGNGMRFDGGSIVRLRNSSSLGNSGSGVVISTNVGKTTRNNDVSQMNLGPDSAGLNTLQSPTSASGPTPNGGTGICLALDAPASGTVTLTAKGNIFGGVTGGPINCSTATAGTKLKFSATCGGKSDVGSSNASNLIDVTTCAYP